MYEYYPEDSGFIKPSTAPLPFLSLPWETTLGKFLSDEMDWSILKPSFSSEIEVFSSRPRQTTRGRLFPSGEYLVKN